MENHIVNEDAVIKKTSGYIAEEYGPDVTEDDLPFIEVGPYCDYLVDLENTGNDWDVIITRLKSKDRVFFFWTKNACKIDISGLSALLKREIEVQFMECGTGHSGLDFQLSSELGFRVASGEKREFCIVSDDKEYDVLIPYWYKRHVKVERISVGHSRPKESPAISAEFDEPVKKKKKEQSKSAARREDVLEGWKGMLSPLLAGEKNKKALIVHFVGAMKAASKLTTKKERMRRIRKDTIRCYGEKVGHRVYQKVHPVVEVIMSMPNPLPVED